MSAHGLITTPFGFDSTAAEVVAGIDLSGKRAIVAGGASGIGVETARALASAGADVTLAVRNTDAGAATSVLVATSPQLAGIGGRYFEDRNESPVVEPDPSGDLSAGVASYAVDPANAERLWDLSQGAFS